MELLLKQIIIPSALLLYGLIFFLRHKELNLYIVIVLTFFAAFSSNFSKEPYRIIYQITTLASIVLLIVNIFRKKVIANKTLIFCIILYLLFILTGYTNKTIDFATYNPTIINYLAVSTISIYILTNSNFYENLTVYLYFIVGLALICSIISCITFTGDRVEGSFANANYLAYFLGIGFTTMMYLNKNKTIKIIFQIIISLAIIFTGSRAIILGCVVILLLSGFISQKPFKSLFLYIIVLFIGLNFFLSSGINRFESNKSEGSSLERVAIYSVSLNIIKESPYFGIGYGQFTKKFKSYLYGNNIGVMKVLRNNKAIVTHNDYVRIAVELGILALSFFLIILIIQLRLLITRIKFEPYGLISMLFIFNLLFSLTHNNMNSFMFWLLFYLPIGYRYYTEKYYLNQQWQYV